MRRIVSNSATDWFYERELMLLPIGRAEERARATSVPIRLPAVAVLGLWIALQFFDELVSITEHNAQTLNVGVAYIAHIGGFLTGLALSPVWRRKKDMIAAQRASQAIRRDMDYYKSE